MHVCQSVIIIIYTMAFSYDNDPTRSTSSACTDLRGIQILGVSPIFIIPERKKIITACEDNKCLQPCMFYCMLHAMILL